MDNNNKMELNVYYVGQANWSLLTHENLWR